MDPEMATIPSTLGTSQQPNAISPTTPPRSSGHAKRHPSRLSSAGSSKPQTGFICSANVRPSTTASTSSPESRTAPCGKASSTVPGTSSPQPAAGRSATRRRV
eukprot:scaffold13881_cov124-Isochrysis_galbana.AAC.5